MVARLNARKIALSLAVLALAGCTKSISNVKCRDVEDEVVELSKGALIKITDAHVISRTQTELVCRGTGIYSDNSEVPTRYRAYMDEDHDIMVAYDTDEAEAAQERQSQRDSDVEAERVARSIEKDFDQPAQPDQ